MKFFIVLRPSTTIHLPVCHGRRITPRLGTRVPTRLVALPNNQAGCLFCCTRTRGTSCVPGKEAAKPSARCHCDSVSWRASSTSTQRSWRSRQSERQLLFSYHTRYA